MRSITIIYKRTYREHHGVETVKGEQYDDGEWSRRLETQSKSRQQVDEEPSNVHYPMVYEFCRENVPAGQDRYRNYFGR